MGRYVEGQDRTQSALFPERLDDWIHEDSKHHLIAAHEVTNVCHDRNLLAHMAKFARDATVEDELIALADRGYYEGYEVLECERAGVAAVVPKPMTSNNAAAGLFDKRDFVYDDKADQYRCQ
jgi:hypothetical protein